MRNPTKPADPIELTLNLPPDGTYPPRLVFTDFSVWIKTETTVVFLDELYVQVIDKEYVIYSASQNNDIKINGEDLDGRQILRDGDLIYFEEDETSILHGIFQVDPVADYRAWLRKHRIPKTTTIYPSTRVAKYFDADEEGISFDANETVTPWHEIDGIYATVWLSTNIWHIDVYQYNRHSYNAVGTAFDKPMLTIDEIHSILIWTYYTSPYMPTFHTIEHDLTETYPNAYTVIAFEKLLIPASKGKLSLPVSPYSILLLPTRSEAKKMIAFRILLTMFVSTLFAGLYVRDAFIFAFTLGTVFLIFLEKREYRNYLYQLRRCRNLEAASFSAIPAHWPITAP